MVALAALVVLGQQGLLLQLRLLRSPVACLH
jgi:hypothetical protein